MPTSPPQVRLPTSLPTPSRLKNHGMASPPEPGEFVDDHHLRSEDRALRLHKVGAVARGHHTQGAPLQILDDVGGQLASVIKALVDDDGLPADLREEVPQEALVPATPRVWHVHIRDTAVGELIDFPAVILNPGQMPEAVFVWNRHDGYLP